MTEPQSLKIELGKTVEAFVFSPSIVNLIYSSKGEGKSLDLLEKVIMADGSVRFAKDVKLGDQLMGDDSLPRNVLAVHYGRDDMYEIIPIKGEPFKCNKEHILVLNHCRVKPILKDTIIEISVKDYLEKNKYFRSSINRLYRSGIDFSTHPVEIPPYFIGMWLADGHSNKIAVTTPDREVVEYIRFFAREWGVGVRTEKISKTNKAKTYYLTNGVHQKNGTNPILTAFRKLNLFNNKHIPSIYKINSREVRLELLAGLIDGDGSFNHEGFDYITKRKNLADDIIYLCRSLGLAAYVQQCKKTIKTRGFVGEYYRIHISGDCSVVPVLLDRKKCKPRKQKKNVLVTGIKKIKYLGKGEYVGWILDGNHRYLLGSFIVSHNTVGCIADAMTHAKRNRRPIRGCVIRDTHENIKISTAISIQKFLPPGMIKFKNDFKRLTIFSEPKVQLDLYGIDDAAAISKIQGPEYAWIWLEEPAPIQDAVNAGLSEDVFNAALAACGRQDAKIIPRLVISMNPADQNHWTYRRFFEDVIQVDRNVYIFTPEAPMITFSRFHIPVGENKNLSELQRQTTRAAYSKDKSSETRFVKGDFAPIYKGKKVTPDYNVEGKHLSLSPLVPARGLVGFRGWDGYGNPACTLGQVTRTGRLVFLDTCYVENSDIRVLIKNQVLPLLESPRWKNKCKAWRDIGDISMATPDQSNKEESAARVIENQFGTFFEKGPAKWHFIRRGIVSALNSDMQGKSSIVVDKNNYRLHKALSGGWHYKVDNAGNITKDIPEKDAHSHPGDAFGNVVSILLPRGNPAREVSRALWNKITQAKKNRVMSYGPGKRK